MRSCAVRCCEAILRDCEPTVLVADAELSDVAAQHLPEGARLLILDEAMAARVGAGGAGGARRDASRPTSG